LILKLNISPKSPRIGLSNDTFAERKRCQVFAYESETTVGDLMSFLIVKMGNKKPQNLPFPLHDVDPHLIQQWGGACDDRGVIAGVIARTTPKRSSDGLGTVAHVPRIKSPLNIS